jgi:hypothetical protein
MGKIMFLINGYTNICLYRHSSENRRDTFLKYRFDKKYFVIYYRSDTFFFIIYYRYDKIFSIGDFTVLSDSIEKVDKNYRSTIARIASIRNNPRR